MSHNSRIQLQVTDVADLKQAIVDVYGDKVTVEDVQDHKTKDVQDRKTLFRVKTKGGTITVSQKPESKEIQTDADWYYIGPGFGLGTGYEKVGNAWLGPVTAKYAENRAVREAQRQGYRVQAVLDQIVNGVPQRQIQLIRV